MIAFLAAYLLDERQIGANVIVANMATVCYISSYGISITATSLIGNKIGRDREKCAKQYAKALLSVSLALASAASILIFCLRNQIGLLYTKDAELLELCSELYPFLALHVIFDMNQTYLGGVIRALGK